MKFIFSLVVVGIFCTDSANSYISSSPASGAAPWKNGAKSSFAQPPSNIGPDDIFREEYHAWAKRYGKSTSDTTRFENFKLNFLLQMQHNKKTGTFNLLNEFGDMTATEFESGKSAENNGSAEVTTTNPKKLVDNVVEVEVIIDEESIPRVRTLDSESIPRVTTFGSPTSSNYATHHNRQRARRKISLDPSPAQPRYSSRDTAYSSNIRSTAYVSRDQQQDSSEPRVYRQDQNQPPQPRRKRRLVRIGPDKIL